MPALAHSSQHTILDQNITANASSLQVVCAWPLSGQYGFGTRILYYVLVATCVLAKRREWLRNACLAGALLYPAVASLHSVVLAALHVDNAVDMDIYGAFQLCSIGILTAPITVNFSETYFKLPTRNLIFVWTGLVLTGMLSLTVEFFRTQTHACLMDNSGNPISSDPALFPYEQADCNLNCFEENGPYSPIRSGSATNDIFVIPAPHTLTFGAVALLAAGASIPPVLTLIFTWEKILERNWSKRYERNQERMAEKMSGTKGVTLGQMMNITVNMEKFGQLILSLIFGGVVLIIVVLGEINFWSKAVLYDTEHFTSVGQWSNLVATALIIFASALVVQESSGIDRKQQEEITAPVAVRLSSQRSSSNNRDPDGRIGRQSISPSRGSDIESARITSIADLDGRGNKAVLQTNQEALSDDEPREAGGNTTSNPNETSATDDSHRKKFAGWLGKMTEYIGNPAPDRYDDSHFRGGEAMSYPKVPGEEWRNQDLQKTEESYAVHRERSDADSIYSVSRAPSFSSMRDHAGSSESPPQSPAQLLRSGTLPVDRGDRPSVELKLKKVTTMPNRKRQNTLEVPRLAPIRPRTPSGPSLERPTTLLNPGESSPGIVVNTAVDTPSEDGSPTNDTLD